MVRLPALLVLGLLACRASRNDAVPSNRGSDAPVPVPPPSARIEGVIGGHHFAITVEHAEATRSEAKHRAWRVPIDHNPAKASAYAELAISDDGGRTEDSKFLIGRSPRVIARNDGGYHVITEVVLDAGGEIFSCLYDERVDDPESATGRAAADRGVAACTSFHVDPL